MEDQLGVIIYVSIVDHINKRPYSLIAPLYYTDLPADVEDQVIEPIYENPDPRATGRTMLPISAMIDMRSKEVPFSFRNSEDIPEVKRYLDMYLQELYTQRSDDEAVAYLAKAAKLQRELAAAMLKLIKGDRTKQAEVEKKNRFNNLITGKMTADQIAEVYYATPNN